MKLLIALLVRDSDFLLVPTQCENEQWTKWLKHAPAEVDGAVMLMKRSGTAAAHCVVFADRTNSCLDFACTHWPHTTPKSEKARCDAFTDELRSAAERMGKIWGEEWDAQQRRKMASVKYLPEPEVCAPRENVVVSIVHLLVQSVEQRRALRRRSPRWGAQLYKAEKKAGKWMKDLRKALVRKSDGSTSASISSSSDVSLK